MYPIATDAVDRTTELATSWKPEVLSAERPDDSARLEELLGTSVRFVFDTLRAQLVELIAGREPSRALSDADLSARIDAHLAGRPMDTYGVWIHYPWAQRLVHVLPQHEFREVRTDRNRLKITHDEQRRLADTTIGIVGLSVGNMAALTFAIEGIGTRFRLADFDHLSLSNLNRLRGGVHELGISKTILAAREMFELDPFLDIDILSRGLDDTSLEAFIAGPPKLDLLVEECDDLYMKVRVREAARDHGIPVVMDTSDRGMLDIERFDREPERPVLHGLLRGVRADDLRGLATEQKVPHVLRLLGGPRISKRMAASLPEVKRTLSTWPQLASGVALGGALTADVARRILLGELTSSGRWYADLEQIVSDETGEMREPES